MSDNVIQFRGKPEGTAESYERPICVLDTETGLYAVVFQGVAVLQGLDLVGRREARCNRPPPGVESIEPFEFEEIRRLGEWVKANGNCGASAVMKDGTVASLTINIPDPWATRTSGGAPKEEA